MSRPRPWTEEEVWKLRRLYPSEVSFEEIVEAFPNRTPNAIRLKASRLGLKRPTPPSALCRSPTILLCSEGDGSSNGYLFRCSECGSWIRVNEGDELNENGAIVCAKCRSTCYVIA